MGMRQCLINGSYNIYLPEHRADRPEWYMEKGWEKKRLQYMELNIDVKDTVFYVGSEEGEMPALCSMWGAEVVMFEPNDKVWANTKAIWEANHLSPPLATIEGFASNFTSPEVPVYLQGFPPSGDGEIISDHAFRELSSPGTIPQLKIDDFVVQRTIHPTIIAMDVEGSEWEVLKGAEETLKKYHPKIFVSWHPEFMFRLWNYYTAEARHWLTDLGYEEVFIDYPLHEVHMMYI